jgi:hypothetical protein
MKKIIFWYVTLCELKKIFARIAVWRAIVIACRWNTLIYKKLECASTGGAPVEAHSSWTHQQHGQDLLVACLLVSIVVNLALCLIWLFHPAFNVTRGWGLQNPARHRLLCNDDVRCRKSSPHHKERLYNTVNENFTCEFCFNPGIFIMSRIHN